MAYIPENPTWGTPRDGNDKYLKFLDGRTYVLEQGVDFTTKQACQVALHRLAKANDLRVQTRNAGVGLLQVRAVTKFGDPLTPPNP